MARPTDTCPECGGASTREWLAGSSERRQCLSGHVWEGEAPPMEPSVEDRLANIERAVSGLLKMADALLPTVVGRTSVDGGLVLAATKRLTELTTVFETRRPT